MNEREKELEGFITQCLPYLEEAWKACFHGNEKALLSAEERGMGILLGKFREIAAGGHPLPPGCLTYAEAAKQAEDTRKWASEMLGNPNQPLPYIKRWVTWGENCANGLQRADSWVLRFAAAAKHLRDADGAQDEAFARTQMEVTLREFEKMRLTQ